MKVDDAYLNIKNFLVDEQTNRWADFSKGQILYVSSALSECRFERNQGEKDEEAKISDILWTQAVKVKNSQTITRQAYKIGAEEGWKKDGVIAGND